MTAEPRVLRAAEAYFGLATKVRWPGPAASIPATPMISGSREPGSRCSLIAAATSDSFIGLCGQIVKESEANIRIKAGQRARREGTGFRESQPRSECFLAHATGRFLFLTCHDPASLDLQQIRAPYCRHSRIEVRRGQLAGAGPAE